jgi:hypothetical protein
MFWSRLGIMGTLVAILTWGSAAAGPRTGYFIEFRSRPDYLFGHTYIVYGRLDGRGRPAEIRYAGRYPLDGERGLVIGSFIPVPASVHAVKDDYRRQPTNVYRRRLSPQQFARLIGLVRRLRADDRWWNLLFANCNDFAITVARGLGMRTPPSWLLPKDFVARLRAMNEG